MCSDTAKEKVIAERLLREGAFPHEVAELQLLETHISWVILTGRIAYKIKKPVKFDFVDYSTLSLRRRYCLQEVELNRRFAPDLYLDVMPIYEIDGNLVIGSTSIEKSEPSNIPVEYAVRMSEFSQDSIVAARLQDPDLTRDAVDQFGKYLAEFHDMIKSNPPSNECGRIERIAKDALDNFPTLLDAFRYDVRHEQVQLLERWTALELPKLDPKFRRRLDARKVRRCHGDLHLKNIIQLDGRLMAFDGIEFNEQFQWIDVLSEIAFPVMDFVARGRADLGWRLLNSYLETSDDYGDLDVLRFYLVYRALVRAKVTWLNPANHKADVREEYFVGESGADELAGPWDKYLDAASYFSSELKPRLSITHGFSGSGKSTLALNFIEKEGGFRIRSDIERQKLATRFEPSDKYSPEMNDWVYQHLAELARAVVSAGMPVVIDATFLEQRRRALFAMLARDLGVEFQILTCDAPFEELCQRIEHRGPDPSEATLDVLRLQMKNHEPLTTEELQFAKALIQ